VKSFLVIWRRELAACFLSPVAYVTMVAFVSVSAFTFLAQVTRNAGGSDPLSVLLFASIIVWLTILVSVVTMRIFAEEKRSGTLESLMTAPVTDSEVVLGKYAGALAFVTIVVAPAVACIFILAALSPGITSVDAGAVTGGCIIIFLVSALSVAIGLLVSLMTRNQIVAAIACFVAIWFVLLFGWLVASVPGVPPKLAAQLSAMSQIEDFARGSVDTRPIVLYTSCTVFVLFAAVRLLESRRWK
jgi:ABC-2 type transport system permease protein